MKNVTVKFAFIAIVTLVSVASQTFAQRQVKFLSKNVELEGVSSDQQWISDSESIEGFKSQDFNKYGLDDTYNEYTNLLSSKDVVIVRSNLHKGGMTFGQMLEKICEKRKCEVEDLSVTQDQILAFRKQHFDLMAENGYATHFLTKNDKGELFVVLLTNTSNGFQAFVKPLSFGYEWSNKVQYRWIIPSKY